MDGKNIASFVKVAEYNHFTKAAEALGYSQAAVTVQIRTLEQELGVPLFDRMGKRIALTQAGKAFLPHAIHLLQAEEEALCSVQPQEELTGTLRICSASSYASEVLPRILPRFLRAHPRVECVVKVSDYLEDTRRRLERGELDFLICLDGENVYPAFQAVAKRKEKLVFVTYPSNPVLTRKRISLETVTKDHFILADSEIGYSTLIKRELNRRGRELHPALEIGSVDAIINILRNGYGTSFIPAFMAEPYLQSGELAEIKVTGVDICLYSYYAVSKNRWMNPLMKEFSRFVEEWYGLQGRSE